MALTLDRPICNRASSAKPPMRVGSIPLRDLELLWRLVWSIALRRPKALWHFALAFAACARRNPRSLECVGITAAFYLHLGPFSRFVITNLDKQIGQIDTGEMALATWRHSTCHQRCADSGRSKCLTPQASDALPAWQYLSHHRRRLPAALGGPKIAAQR